MDLTPVIIGVGEASERIEEAGYIAASPAELAAQAGRAALLDAGIDGAVIDTVGGVRQFEISRATAVAPFGRADNFPRAVARRLGADPRRAILEITGGQSPQKLVNELAHEIAAGRAGTALIFGAEAISTVRHLQSMGAAPDWSETVGGQLEDRGYQVDGLAGEVLVRHGATRPLPLYALFENARRARLGLMREEYRLEMGRLFAPFTKVAAANPHAMSRQALTAEEIAEVTPKNRLTCDPFPRRVVSRDQANQGAAVLLTSVGQARAMGVPEHRFVYLFGGADLKERPVIERPDLSRSPAAKAAIDQALSVAGIGLDAVSHFDLYSCFPIAVFNVLDAYGLSPDDPRGFTVTGGLPFFGGAGNNYSMHALAGMVRRLRDKPGDIGLIGANGGYLSKYSVGLYSAGPAPFRPFDSAPLQARLDAAPPVPLADPFDGAARVESYTIDHDANPARALIIGRAGDTRIVAACDNPALVREMATHDPLTAVIEVKPAADGRNHVFALD